MMKTFIERLGISYKKMFFEEETAESKRCKFEAQEFTTLMSYLPN